MSAASLPPAVSEAALFHRLRWLLLRNTWNQLAGHSLVRPVTILMCSVLVWVFVFGVSYAGFRFQVQAFKLPPDGQIIGLLLGLLFFALGLLLIFSGGLILYGSLFTAAETAFLLSKPLRADQVFAYKFQGAMGFSSWAFVLLGSPVLISYGLVCHSPWYFYVALPFFFLGYVLLPGSISAMLCLLIVNFVPRRRKELVILIVLLLIAGAGWYIYRMAAEGRAAARAGDTMVETASNLLNRISFARSLWLPSAWVARGLQAAGRGDHADTGYYLALVWSNGLFLYLIATAAASRLYRRGFNRLTTGGDLRRKHGGAWLDAILARLLPFVHPGTRLLIVKDFRTFRRDPQQWGQVLLFTGLLVLYFTNIRRMFVRDIEWVYQNGISVLNLCAIALLLCTYTGRFIYPLLSLEGRKFWILGLLPLKREQLLWGKFAFSTTGGLLLAGSLILLSDFMLEMPLDAMLLHLLTVAVLTAGLSGLSVGLGACMPNFRESDPSKIAVGFGGTLNLVISLGFLLVILALMAGPWHLFMAGHEVYAGVHEADSRRPLIMLPVVLFTAVVGIVVGAMAVLVPLRAGTRALEKMEF
jgi:ABC-2 type transport system permease protein